MKKISNLFIGSATGVWLFCRASVSAVATGVLQADTLLNSPAELGTSWRHTKFGWQDSSRWFVDSFAPVKTFEVIHPILWAALVLITVVGVMIWASEEWDIERLFDDEEA